MGLVPHRIEIFAWTSLLGRINTKCKLTSLGTIPQSEDICVLYNASLEHYNHLLLHCPFSLNIWNWWLDSWHVKWSLPETLRALFDQWNSSIKSPFFKKVRMAIFFIITWSIWKERNSWIFENASSTPSGLRVLILLRLECRCIHPHIDRAAIGGVLRNHLGHFICVFSSPIAPMEINYAEVLAIHRALSISHSCNALNQLIS